jgi:hypothetical protein
VEGAPGRKRRGDRPWLHVSFDPHAAREAPPPYPPFATKAPQPVMVDVLGAELTDAGPMPGASPGSAQTSELVIYEDQRTETGIWEVTPGVFDAAHGPYVEFMHFVAGEATITTADREVHEVRPGTTLTVPPAWRAHWEVRATVRKTYVIVHDAR